jgi:hypothetical protein
MWSLRPLLIAGSLVLAACTSPTGPEIDLSGPTTSTGPALPHLPSMDPVGPCSSPSTAVSGENKFGTALLRAC